MIMTKPASRSARAVNACTKGLWLWGEPRAAAGRVDRVVHRHGGLGKYVEDANGGLADLFSRFVILIICVEQREALSTATPWRTSP